MKTVLTEKNGRTIVKPLRASTPRVKKPVPLAVEPGPALHPQKILVPLDFSPCSAKALDYAVAFARPARAEIILMHVVQPVDFPMYGQEIMADYTALNANLLATGRQHLAEFSRTKLAAATPPQLVVRQGSAWGEIVAAAQDEDVDLIILSTHGHTGLRHVLLGSTAERVVRHAPCPVLVVRERERECVTPSDASPH